MDIQQLYYLLRKNCCSQIEEHLILFCSQVSLVSTMNFISATEEDVSSLLRKNGISEYIVDKLAGIQE